MRNNLMVGNGEKMVMNCIIYIVRLIFLRLNVNITYILLKCKIELKI